jgi:predicted DNA-binding ribbon-helix-helix protein
MTRPPARRADPGRPSAQQPRATVIRPIKRSFRIAGHQTSISLEPIFWDALKAAAAARGVTPAQFVADVDATRGATNLSSAIRVWLFADAQRRCQPSRAPDTGAD